MEKEKILESIAHHGNGEIYLGVVGAVRSGKSTFIKRFIENLVVPNIEDEYEKKRCLDEIPQSAQGKAIMTTEPKFVPSTGANIKIDDFQANVKLIDCVGYIVDGATGFEDEDGNPRMVKTPWFDENMPFIEAAEIGTEKVIKDHSTIGIVITSDGSFGEIKRNSYIEAEEKVISQLKSMGKPFIVILNSADPQGEKALRISNDLKETYDVPVVPISVEKMNETEIYDILKKALYEFPVMQINVNIPEWIDVLDNDHEIKKHYLEKIKESVIEVDKIKDVDNIISHFEADEYIKTAKITELDTKEGIITLSIDSDPSLYNEVLKNMMGSTIATKASLLKVFKEFSSGREEYDQIKNALKQAKSTGYGIVYPTLKEMKLETPEIIKQGSRYGVKLNALASSIHLIKVDVESTFEPIIGSELQSKELIDYLMKDYETNPSNIWKSEIFGRSLDEIVKEGIQAKLSIMPENTRYKLGKTITKIVNKGANNLIALVI